MNEREKEIGDSFLSTLNGLTEKEALHNLRLDTKLYGWTDDLHLYIRNGIHDYYSEEA
jgi:hypothetical protein